MIQQLILLVISVTAPGLCPSLRACVDDPPASSRIAIPASEGLRLGFEKVMLSQCRLKQLGLLRGIFCSPVGKGENPQESPRFFRLQTHRLGKPPNSGSKPRPRPVNASQVTKAKPEDSQTQSTRLQAVANQQSFPCFSCHPFFHENLSPVLGLALMDPRRFLHKK